MSFEPRNEEIRFAWPPDVSEVELELYVGRGRMRLHPDSSVPPNLAVLHTPTRLKIAVLDEERPESLTLEFEVEGESPIPPTARVLPLELPPLKDRPGTHGTLASLEDLPRDSRLLRAMDKDEEAIEACRRFYSEGPDPVSRWRLFFYEIDQRTNTNWELDDRFRLLSNNLEVRQRAQVLTNVKPEKLPGLKATEHDMLWELFEDAGSHLTLDEQLTAFLWFGAGLLEHRCPHLAAAAGPNSGFVTLLMQLALDAQYRADEGARAYWLTRLPTLIYMVEIFGRRFDDKKNIKATMPHHRRRSYAVGPLEIERDRADFVEQATLDPNTTAAETLLRHFNL
ncbi:MAG: hypothetical protein KJO43_05195 [Phycisphaerae bacterium]|nr:hypothetical protein [Phycisphaerae bacterium]